MTEMTRKKAEAIISDSLDIVTAQKIIHWSKEEGDGEDLGSDLAFLRMKAKGYLLASDKYREREKVLIDVVRRISNMDMRLAHICREALAKLKGMGE